MTTRDEPVYIRVEDEHILGTLITPGTLLPGVLFVHGWGGDQQQYVSRARELSGLGCVCVTFDLRGHAQTQAQFELVSREDSMRDVLAAYDFLAGQHNVDSDPIAVVGSSYGGYLAALLTALRPVKWLALRVPALYKDSEWRLPKLRLRREQALEQYRLQPVNPDESNALRVCREYTGDVLIVESEHDTVIPHQVIVNYRESFVGAHIVDVPVDGRRRSRVVERDVASRVHGVARELVQRNRVLQEAKRETRCRTGAISTAPEKPSKEGQPQPEA